uniref:Uncharacterized protein n=1 Tax=Siphoviridae sp. ct5d86 TaxID=2827561 RepID=A0A8S5LM56_9CAUD|nr:MAG TPA: hypothetical protein [Siphoviridae sp. ct5d86]
MHNIQPGIHPAGYHRTTCSSRTDPGQMCWSCNISPPGMGEKPLIYQVAVNPGCTTLYKFVSLPALPGSGLLHMIELNIIPGAFARIQASYNYISTYKINLLM